MPHNDQLKLAIEAEIRRYPVILADPPWRYDHSNSRSRRIENQYETLTLDQICGMNVGDFATAGSVLFLWATAPKLLEALQVMAAWGFGYTTQMVWDKVNLGRGYWARGVHEPLLIGTRAGTRPPPPSTRPRSIFSEARGEHSRKPDRFHEIIEEMFPTEPKLELFARRRRAGWHCWGNEVESDVALIVPPGPENPQLGLDV